MSGLAIPNDWNEAQDGYCTLTIIVPNSPMWRASVNGAVSNLTYEKSWDKDTSDIVAGGGTFDGQVSAGNDDAHQKADGSGFFYGLGWCDNYSDPSDATRSIGGYRFQNVAVPQAAPITAAWLSVMAIGAARDDANVEIYGQAIDDAPDFGAADIVSRALTTSFVSWVQVGIGTSEVNTPDITSVVQEIVNQPGWTSGQSMAVFLVGKSDIHQELRLISYDGTPANAVKLHIEYDAGGSSTSPEQAAAIGQDILDSILTDCP